MTFVAANTPFKEPSSVATESSIEEGSKVVSLSVSDTETLGDVNSVQSIQKYLHSEDSAVKEASKESDKAAPSEASPREVKDVVEESKDVVEESQSIQKESQSIQKESQNVPKESQNSPEPPHSSKEPNPESIKTSSQPLAAKEHPPISIAASQAASTKPPRLLCVVPLELLQHHQSLVEARETASHLRRELALAQCVLQLLTDSLHVLLRWNGNVVLAAPENDVRRQRAHGAVASCPRGTVHTVHAGDRALSGDGRDGVARIARKPDDSRILSAGDAGDVCRCRHDLRCDLERNGKSSEEGTGAVLREDRLPASRKHFRLQAGGPTSEGAAAASGTHRRVQSATCSGDVFPQLRLLSLLSEPDEHSLQHRRVVGSVLSRSTRRSASTTPSSGRRI